jgi:hypothetical protein
MREHRTTLGTYQERLATKKIPAPEDGFERGAEEYGALGWGANERAVRINDTSATLFRA